MRFLANENFPGAAVTILKSAGHDVIWQAHLGTRHFGRSDAKSWNP